MTAVRAPGARALANYLQQEMAAGRLREGMKLPAERELSERFGTSRGAVRRVLQEFANRGLLSKAVGSGTFVQAAAATVRRPTASAAGDDASSQTSPAELMEARLLIEPLMPALIVRNATRSDFLKMDACLAQTEQAQSLEDFEQWDAELHRALAEATHNAFFLKILDLVNAVRSRAEWGQLKRQSLSPARRAEYEAQHREIVAALRDRDAESATATMRSHLLQIRRNLFEQ
ncbi:FadR family transcriptional regulator [Burkholderia sp. WAC0059]|uniref:FadR/GntR family transcriptional regulator n=1 Tax=Burkholderia sp. WAC0059 TaxID=2066022 RepID=UPI000C7F1AD4|nr:FCD domain-containing protein [Burkholderia sp. WAC0059]PLZ02628.1 FadR family transcriptional regulator [Burkholderia sp. WAC0059]